MKISIITINFNKAEGVKATLDSVSTQTCREFEHIIIDGGSTDGSMEIIREYEFLNRSSVHPLTITWTSEKDSGIYDAMNKGVKKASGNYVYFLNSGDCLASTEVVRQMYEQMDGSDLIVGRVNKTSNGQIVGQTPLLSENDMSLYNIYLQGINHQSVLIKRDLLIKKPYDATIRLNADWKFFVQTIVLGGATTKFVDMMFANYDISGVSANVKAVIEERRTILASIIPKRVARDYLTIAPYYYEVVRIKWLLRHPFFYRVYRAWTTLGRKLLKR